MMQEAIYPARRLRSDGRSDKLEQKGLIEDVRYVHKKGCKDVNIYLDMDDVLCDTAAAYLALLAREFDMHVDFEEVFSFNLQKSFGLSDEQNNRLFTRAHEPEFVGSLKPMEGMLPVLGNWKKQGFILSILTGRHTSASEASQQWLKEHNIPYHSFTMVDKYNWSGTDRNIAISLEQMSRLSFDFGVEDSPKMADYLSCEMSMPVVLFDRPWNRNYELQATGRRCRGWLEVETTCSEFKPGSG